MKNFKKIVSCALISVLMLVSVFTFPVSAASTARIVIQTCTISETGAVEVYGYIANTTNDSHEVTFLLLEGDKWSTAINNITKVKDGFTNIAYIDQKTTGNNQSFLFKCQVNEKFLGKNLVLGMNSNADTDMFNATLTSDIKKVNNFSLMSIANNDVIYGLDAYTLTSKNLTARNVADSIVYGGNKIYYKIGNNWYDLLDEKATDNSYLVEKNKVDFSAMEKLNLRYYYVGEEKLIFKK